MKRTRTLRIWGGFLLLLLLLLGGVLQLPSEEKGLSGPPADHGLRP